MKKKLTRRLLATLCLFMVMMLAHAQQFEQYFSDNTLRLDYIFSGDAHRQTISLDKLNVMPRWYGRKARLAELPADGNGQLTVRSHRTGEVIYRHFFSTLFQEWLSYPEAETTSRAFENVFLVPMPKDTVDVTVTLRDNRRQVMCEMTHTVAPQDILIRHIGQENVTPYVTLQQAADPDHCIHIAFVAEGYQESEMDTYIADAQTAIDAIFAHEPFKTERSKFNIIAVKSLSKDSGTSTPSKGIWKNTALHSHFDTFYSNRYLTTLSIKTLHDWLAGTPYEHIIILVNTDEYGGGGILNSYVLSMTHHAKYRPVITHEFGHSFCGLADEYAYESEDIPMYPHDVEPWEANITTLVDFDSKWKDMVTPDKSIGLYEGAGYNMKGIYRPTPDCRMRTNEHPDFCPVCQRALRRLIDFYTK